MNRHLLLLLGVIALVCLVYAAPFTSDSPTDEWWMVGGNITYSSFALSNAPANITNATVNFKVFSETVSTPPLIVGNSVFIIPQNFGTIRAYELNASNVSQQFQNSSSTTYTIQTAATYYDGSLFFHSSSLLRQINASNLSQTIATVSISDFGYYAAPTIYNNSVYIGSGNAAPFMRQLNVTNISQVLFSLAAGGRIYESTPVLGPYAYVPGVATLRQVDASNVSRVINSVACAANGIEYIFPVTSEFVYKTCTVNSVDMLMQFNATNVSRQVANFSNGSAAFALGNGYLYFGSGSKAYQLNASNVSQQIATFNLYTSYSTTAFPVVNRDYLFIAAGSVVYQLDARNISRLIGNFTAASTVSGPLVLAKGYLYFGAGTRLYQLGTPSSYVAIDSISPSVTLNSPSVGYSNDTAPSLNVTFNCSVSDDVALQNVSLYLTNNANQSFSFNQSTDLSGTSSFGYWNLNLSSGNYTWNCLGVDTSGNSASGGSNRSITLNFTDVDGDGVTDSQDRLIGNNTSVSASGVSSLNITVDGSSPNGSISGDKQIVLYDGANRLINFTFNFSLGTLYLSRIIIVKADNSVVVNLSGQLQSGRNKTITLADNNFTSLCAKDSEIASVSSISDTCTGANETNLTACLGNSTGVVINGLTCLDSGSSIDVGNLANSGIRGTPIVLTSSNSNTTVSEQAPGYGNNYIYESQASSDEVRLFTWINKGESVKKVITNPKGTGISEFELKAKDWLTGQVFITFSNNIPDNCNIAYPNNYSVYKVLAFNHTFDNNVVEEARVRLTINKDWIYDNKISQVEVVKCYPYYEKLTTSYLDEDSSTGTYDVYSNSGFSTWAVIGTYGGTEDVQNSPASDGVNWRFSWPVFFTILILVSMTFIVWMLHKKHAEVRDDFELRNKWFDLKLRFSLRFRR